MLEKRLRQWDSFCIICQKWKGNATEEQKILFSLVDILIWFTHFKKRFCAKLHMKAKVKSVLLSLSQNLLQDVHHQDGAAPAHQCFRQKGHEQLSWVSTWCHNWDSGSPGAVRCNRLERHSDCTYSWSTGKVLKIEQTPDSGTYSYVLDYYKHSRFNLKGD